MVDDTTRTAHADDYQAKSSPEPEFPRGALCAEAQADGVPCTELGRKCETCEKAMQRADPTAW